MAWRWYVVRVQRGSERIFGEALAEGLASMHYLGTIRGFHLPAMGDPPRLAYPGHIMVEMDIDGLDAAEWEAVRDVWRQTPGFGDFVGSHDRPDPMSEDEVQRIMRGPDETEVGAFVRGEAVEVSTQEPPIDLPFFLIRDILDDE